MRLLLLISILLFGCTEQSVDPIQLGQDYCDFCKMQITDKRYGGAILTKKGKTYKFDAVECLSAYKKSIAEEVSDYFYVDFETSQLYSHKKINLYRNEQMHGPMGTKIQTYTHEINLPKVNLEEINQ